MGKNDYVDGKKENGLTAKQALEKLKAGNRRFIKHHRLKYQTKKERASFADGQSPYAIILSCADSRVSPEIMFNAGLNELFVLRVAGNVADTASIASIEFAVTKLKTKLIVVVGHEKCGAVDAALANAERTVDWGYNLNSLLAQITPAVAATQSLAGEKRLKETIKKNAELNGKELRARSSTIAQAPGVEIVSAYYHLVSGRIKFLKFL